MLRKDKALLERLTKKYGRNYILNEISNELITKARDKASKTGRRYQQMFFQEEFDRRERLQRTKNEERKKRELDKVLSNLSLELLFDHLGYEFYVDKNYPIAVGWNGDDQIMISVGERIYPSFENEDNYIASRICETLNIDIDNIENIDVDRIGKNIEVNDAIYWSLGDPYKVTKQVARDYANFGKVLNERFGIKWLEENWHYIYNYFWDIR
jgi:hypothetical protein